MTRGEEIIKEAELCASANTQIIGDWGEHFLGFVHGAEWADAHPHWISVEDELPKINPNGSEWDYSDDVLVYLKDGSITVGRWERDNSTGEQYWLLDIEKDLIVTHWMPLPSTEHIADANKKVDRVIGTADHIKTALDVLNKKGGEK